MSSPNPAWKAERISRPLRAFGLLPPLGLDQLGNAAPGDQPRAGPAQQLDRTVAEGALFPG